MKVKRVSYVERYGVIKRLRKHIIEIVEADAFISYDYQWSDSIGKWMPTKSTAYFDGITCKEVGVLHITENAERYAELLTKYSGFEYMDPGEDNKDTHKEDEYLNSILNQSSTK